MVIILFFRKMKGHFKIHNLPEHRINKMRRIEVGINYEMLLRLLSPDLCLNMPVIFTPIPINKNALIQNVKLQQIEVCWYLPLNDCYARVCPWQTCIKEIYILMFHFLFRIGSFYHCLSRWLTAMVDMPTSAFRGLSDIWSTGQHRRRFI